MSDGRHLMVLIADHFEPLNAALVREWCTRYAEVAATLRDDDGVSLRWTWFYDGEDPEALDILADAVRRGLGEVGLHLHHRYDTAESLREKIERRKKLYAQHGALMAVGDPPKLKYGFVHGKWALANSRGPQFCGVNDELRILHETGCYADFTFPAWGRMQPRMTNVIYYARSDPSRPKSYDTGVPVRVGGAPTGDLMIFPGPGRLSGIPDGLARWPMLRVPLERVYAPPALSMFLRVRPWKVRRWLRAGVCVQGRPEWVFVKLHCHGVRAKTMEALFGGGLQEMAATFASQARAGGWQLHYVTAREAYNIVRAAEAGRTGNPHSFRRGS